MNLNKLAKLISQMEHGKVQVNIAQIKEVLKCIIIFQASSVYAQKQGYKKAMVQSDELAISVRRSECKHADEIMELINKLYGTKSGYYYKKKKGKKK